MNKKPKKPPAEPEVSEAEKWLRTTIVNALGEGWGHPIPIMVQIIIDKVKTNPKMLVRLSEEYRP